MEEEEDQQREEPEPEVQYEFCPDCAGTGLDLITDGGGSCPGCVGGRREAWR